MAITLQVSGVRGSTLVVANLTTAAGGTVDPDAAAAPQVRVYTVATAGGLTPVAAAAAMVASAQVGVWSTLLAGLTVPVVIAVTATIGGVDQAASLFASPPGPTISVTGAAPY